MSLLLDALKRAEQEKLARQPGGPPPTSRGGSSAPVAANLELQPIGPAPGPSAPPPTPRQDAAAAHAAQNVFQAKAADNDPEKSRSGLWLLVGAIAFVAIAAASYVWYTVKALTPPQAGARMRQHLPLEIAPLHAAVDAVAEEDGLRNLPHNPGPDPVLARGLHIFRPHRYHDVLTDREALADTAGQHHA